MSGRRRADVGQRGRVMCVRADGRTGGVDTRCVQGQGQGLGPGKGVAFSDVCTRAGTVIPDDCGDAIDQCSPCADLGNAEGRILETISESAADRRTWAVSIPGR